jgi:hypothetical protein
MPALCPDCGQGSPLLQPVQAWIALSLRPGSLTRQAAPTPRGASSCCFCSHHGCCRVAPAERLLWWWFGTLFVFSIFSGATPNSHVYTFFIPWVLLGGMVAAALSLLPANASAQHKGGQFTPHSPPPP